MYFRNAIGETNLFSRHIYFFFNSSFIAYRASLGRTRALRSPTIRRQLSARYSTVGDPVLLVPKCFAFSFGSARNCPLIFLRKHLTFRTGGPTIMGWV